MVLTVSMILSAVVFGVTGQIQGAFAQRSKASVSGATGWLNTQPLSLADLRGKVVLIDFWTYTCINWRRTLPYTLGWAAKYKDQGLVVIGVHTPEFSFERKTENISSALKEMGIDYPVAIDNNYDIWGSFRNQYWPARYLIDAKGRIRYQKFGEGDYQESEVMIRQLLKEASAKDVPAGVLELQPQGVEAAADWQNLRSAENYVGYNRTQGFASPGGIVPDRQVLYAAPGRLKLNEWGLSGGWTAGEERISLNRTPGKIIYRFHARDLNLVMGPATPGTTVRFRILIDGNPPGAAHGVDVDSNGNGTVTGQRMYQLLRQQEPVTDREFQIEFLDPQVEVYCFTFG